MERTNNGFPKNKMKIAISYFYQIRNFKPWMIPLSTCLSDPKWYYNTIGKDFWYFDKRNILNGLRFDSIIVQDKCQHCCPCAEHNPNNCSFLKDYRKELNKLDFQQLLYNLQRFADWYKDEYKIKEEIIIVLIVYEAPKNLCSERKVLIEYFNDNGIDCQELKYPIKDNY